MGMAANRSMRSCWRLFDFGPMERKTIKAKRRNVHDQLCAKDHQS